MFYFEKWYMDATDEDGRSFVGYYAHVKWRLFDLVYNGFTFLPTLISRFPIKKQSSFTLTSTPIVNKGTLEWNCFGVSASWQQSDNTIEERLYSAPEGEIRWSCCFPKAKATVAIEGEQFSKSLGYVEKITMTIPPWKVPIHQLHWGRFLSENHTIIWIRWVGPVPKNLIFHNGKKSERGMISEFRIQTEAFDLKLKNPRTLRKGSILSTVFSNFPSIKKIFPRSIMNLKENKWSSLGELYIDSQPVVSGSVIHELVVW